jgi:DNA-binding HxlR family transcriptional regulator
MGIPRDSAFCPVFHHAIELIGKRWTGVILHAILAGCTRYADIRDAVPGLSDTMLGERLRELEAEGLVTREVATGPPIRVNYRLTPKGEALQDAIQAVAAWADVWVEEPAPPERKASIQRLSA